MQARDIMSAPVITVPPDATVGAIATQLLQRRISAVPVADATGRVLGIVSEADLMHRPEIRTAWKAPWWLRLLSSTEDLAADYIKARGMLASEVMRKEALSVPPTATLSEMVAKMERDRVKRLLVMDGETLVGIVTRADLLRAVLAGGVQVRTDDRDRAIRTALLGELNSQDWWTLLPHKKVTVSDGVVTLSGVVASEEERTAAHIAARSVPGVRKIKDHLVIEPILPALVY